MEPQDIKKENIVKCSDYQKILEEHNLILDEKKRLFEEENK